MKKHCHTIFTCRIIPGMPQEKVGIWESFAVSQKPFIIALCVVTFFYLYKKYKIVFLFTRYSTSIDIIFEDNYRIKEFISLQIYMYLYFHQTLILYMNVVPNDRHSLCWWCSFSFKAVFLFLDASVIENKSVRVKPISFIKSSFI